MGTDRRRRDHPVCFANGREVQRLDFHRWRDNGNPQTEEHNVLAGTMLKGLYSKTGSFLTRKDSLLFGVDLLYGLINPKIRHAR